MAPDRERLIYLFGEDVADIIDDEDLATESGRMELVRQYLDPPSSSGETGVAVRTVAVNQILDDNPPATWQAVLRMADAGLDRENVLRQLSMIILEHLRAALDANKPVDNAQLVEALNGLPLPTIEEIAEALVATARAHPGARDHVERTVDGFQVRSGTAIVQSLAESLLDRMTQHALHWLADDGTVVFHDTIADRVFTHRISDSEFELQMLTVSVDLAAFTRFDAVRLTDGTELEQFSAEHGHLAWRGPDGWLAGFSPGELLAVSAEFTPPRGEQDIEATITIRVLDDEPPVTDELATLARQAYDVEQSEHGLPVAAEDLLIELCHADPELFRAPLPPLGAWCEASGMTWNGNYVAHDDETWRAELARRRWYQIYDLVDDAALSKTLGKAVQVLDDPSASVDEVRAALRACAEPAALDVLAEVLIPDYLRSDDEFEFGSAFAPGRVFELVGRATAVAQRDREVVTAEYLACVLRERCGQPLIAIEHLTRAAQAGADMGPVIERMGWYCFDRGDARGAQRWWRDLAGEHPGMSVIQPFLSASGGGAKIGRNDPCWCGSGRKFKHCHQTFNNLPALPDRVGWLYAKAAGWLRHGGDSERQMISDLAMAWMVGDSAPEAIDELSEEDVEESLGEAITEPIVLDAALHEGGLWSLFLHERGGLLPDDERLLAAAWQTTDRSVHEVVAVERGTGMTVRDLATGDEHQIRERTMSRHAKVGEMYCARVVTDGESHQLIGAILAVPAGREQAVLAICDEGDPAAICAWAGAAAQAAWLDRRGLTSPTG